ncbi:hypothetical protein HYZ97_05125 [Candidatus Pacearchaeota archaeon]|nr:hypothetical protein [Candidatus Pacearchaeota archaeon]
MDWKTLIWILIILLLAGGLWYYATHPIGSISYGNETSSGEQIYCTQEVQECPDGSFVGRDPARNCSFRPCP